MPPAEGGTVSVTWRAGVAAVFVAVGTLFVTSALSSDGIDLRPERYGDLESLTRQQSRQVDALQARVAALTAEVEELAAGVDDSRLDELEAEVAQVRGPAGFQPVKGPGVTVVLDDAPASSRDLIDGVTTDLDDLVVHQQDIQAVVNALWEGGAEAMTVQGQRVISTTGIKCVGNVVILHGRQYAPPYEITAIGNTDALLGSLATSPAVETYRQYVAAFGLGYLTRLEPLVAMPAYEGGVELSYARSAGAPPSGGTRDSDL